ncbi:hypothetical protein SMACR_09892 [Sordaria macrospora]|uniref:Uncharacterized protein n=1 Tax=Sordaria macrospora TaxID=5147 RepID=A0A8S8ZES0_SORMA|nr:hypothetical protein SMACR_09892 [Sordaria macrospora]WPJ64395.1 hypothetical protein SMAC4_09892 [Sordaria macrospora]
MPAPFDWSLGTNLEDLPTTREKLARGQAQEMAKTLHNFQESARPAIAKAQERQTVQANRGRREPDFGHIKAMKGYSYELDFPDTWRGARVYHARRLRKDPNNPLPGQANENPTSEMVGGREEWEVARILISKLLYGRLHYQWNGRVGTQTQSGGQRATSTRPCESESSTAKIPINRDLQCDWKFGRRTGWRIGNKSIMPMMTSRSSRESHLCAGLAD